MKYWIISDHHFGHYNIIRYCGRPYQSVEEMDRDMIAKWNAVVPVDGRVIHLGDFSFHKPDRAKAILASLNGKEKRIVQGNHDRLGKLLDMGWDAVLPLLKIGRTLLVHSPRNEAAQKHTGWVFHGHIHDRILEKPLFRNFSVEAVNYFPVEVDF